MTHTDKTTAHDGAKFGKGAKNAPGAKTKTRWQKVRKPLMVAVFVIINIAVIAATAVAEFGNSKNATGLANVKLNGWLLIPATACFLVAFILDIYKYVLMIRKNTPPGTFQRGEDWKLARRTVILGRYYDNITPAAVGGQPFQIYYMRRSGKLPSGLATTLPMMGMISLQVGFIIVATVSFLSGGLSGENGVLFLTAWLGLIFYAFWPVMVVMVMIFPRATAKFINFIMRALAKIKIIKDPAETSKKIEHEVGEYAKSVKLILKSRGLILRILALSVAYNLLIASIPFFVLTAFGGEVDFVKTFTSTVAVMSTVYFIPTPGNSGAAEGTFFLVFSALSDGYVFWAMLVWRFFSYYIYIIMGPVTYFFINLEKKHNARLVDKTSQKGQIKNKNVV